MRDWLLHSEWCDVRLLCRGRVFSAHRAVLASVSSYLRCILVSHPAQETPIYIVLPDFDWEAMSSVLYYVYNGEINVPIENLTSFFEIIHTLKIFVDKSALRNVKEHFGDTNNVSFKQRVFEEDNTQTNTGESDDMVKLEYKSSLKETPAKENTNQYSRLQLFTCNQTEQSTQIMYSPYIDNTQTQDGEIQKNSPLRDPLTENNSHNSKNIQSPDVPTITNESNLQLLSGSVMNGNDSGTDVVSDPASVVANAINSYGPFETIQRCYNRYNNLRNNYQDLQKSLNMTTQDMKMLHKLLSLENISQKSGDINNKKKNNSKSTVLRPLPTLVPIKNYASHHSELLDLSKYLQQNNPQVQEKYLNYTNAFEETITQKAKEQGNKIVVIDRNIRRSKKSPLNQVLASPWTPCLPGSYRPFNKKISDVLHNLDNQEQEKVVKPCEEIKEIINDTNNNLSLVRVNLETAEESTSKLKSVNSNRCNEEPTAEEEELAKTDIDCEASSNEESCEDIKRQSLKTRHTCSECGKSFSQLRNYKYHVSVHRGTREFAATCTICGKYFNDRGYLSSHMKIHRNRKEYQCPDCPKSFNQRVAYNMHIRIHTGVKPHVCAECGKAFSRKMLLKQHLRTHSGERPYACSFCDKRFADRSNMTLHMRLHSGVKPFSCDLCPKSFTKKHHLKTHLNYHSGAKPYPCPRCNTAFSQSSNMRTHLKKCTADASTT